MSEPFQLPGRAGGGEVSRARGRGRARSRAVVASLAVVAGTVVCGVAAGFGWAAVAPRALLVMTGPGTAGLVNVETNAFIAADAAFSLICLAGGVVSGLFGYLLAVRRYGPPAMAAVLVGALAAALAARWIGEQSGLAGFHHLLATLPTGAHLRDSLTLGANGAVAFWPLAASLVAGGLASFANPGRHRLGAAGPALAGEGPGVFPGYPAGRPEPPYPREDGGLESR